MPNKKLIGTLLLFQLLIGICESAKSNILVITYNALFSHFQLSVEISNALQKNGHQVVLFVEEHHGITDRNHLKIGIDPGVEVVIRYFDPEFPVQFETDTAKSYTNWDRVLYSSNQQKYWDLIAYRAVAHYYELAQRDCNKDLMEKWRNLKFDLGIAENRDLGAFAIFHDLGIRRTIATTATPAIPPFMHFLDLPLLLTVPEHFSARFGDCADKNCIQNAFRQKKNEWRYRMSVAKFEQIYERIHREFYIQKYGVNEMPKMAQLFKNSKLFLANTIEEASIPRPMLNKIRHIGGIATKTDLYKNKWTNPAESDKCIILMTFGSIVSYENVPESTLKAMVDAFGQFVHQMGCQFVAKLPLIQISKYYRIDYAKNVQKIAEFVDMDLIQLDPIEDLLKNGPQYQKNKPLFPQNVYPTRWVKQQEFLASPNVRVLITHCGQNSLNEAIFAGVPVLCMPFFGDQHFNAATMEYHELGIRLQAPGLEKGQIHTALRRLFEPRWKYQQNSRNLALKLQKKMKEFGTPADQFAKLIDQALEGKFDFEDGKVIGMDKVPGGDGNIPTVDFSKKLTDAILNAQTSDEAMDMME